MTLLDVGEVMNHPVASDLTGLPAAKEALIHLGVSQVVMTNAKLGIGLLYESAQEAEHSPSSSET